MVVISDATRGLVTRVFVLEDLGSQRLKGVAEPLRTPQAAPIRSLPGVLLIRVFGT